VHNILEQLLFSSLADRTWFMQLPVGHNPNMARAITGKNCESTCFSLGLNDCAKCIAHDLFTSEGIDLKETLVIKMFVPEGIHSHPCECE